MSRGDVEDRGEACGSKIKGRREAERRKRGNRLKRQRRVVYFPVAELKGPTNEWN